MSIYTCSTSKTHISLIIFGEKVIARECTNKKIYRFNLILHQWHPKKMSPLTPSVFCWRRLQAKVTWNWAKQICTPSRSRRFETWKSVIRTDSFFGMKKHETNWQPQYGVEILATFFWVHIWDFFCGKFCRSQCVHYHYLFFCMEMSSTQWVISHITTITT